MTIHVPPQLAQTIRELLAAGCYMTPAELIRDALMLLKDRQAAMLERINESPRD